MDRARELLCSVGGQAAFKQSPLRQEKEIVSTGDGTHQQAQTLPVSCRRPSSELAGVASVGSGTGAGRAHLPAPVRVGGRGLVASCP